MKIFQKLSIFLLMTVPLRLNAAPEVVVSIAPVHSLASMVLEGVGEPKLILPGGQSPHTFALTPSMARKVLDADLVVYVSDHYETGLRKMIENVGSEQLLELMEARDQLNVLPLRQGGAWEDHDHIEGHESGHASEDYVSTDNLDDHREHSDDRLMDPHIWLSPDNAKNIVLLLRDRLSLIDPMNSQRYFSNANAAIEKISVHIETVRHKLGDSSHKPYLVFHDAFQYFELYFDLHALGSVTLGPELKPGARRISDLRQLIKEEGVLCIFNEPQFAPRMLSNLVEGLEIARGRLDPLGAEIEVGAELWFKLTINLAESLNSCLH